MYDAYVLAPDRKADTAFRFLDAFVPEREPNWNWQDLIEELGLVSSSTLEDILTFLEEHSSCETTLYLSNLKKQRGLPRVSILAYLEDGGLILGLYCGNDPKVADTILTSLEQFNGTQGYCYGEHPPARSRAKFREERLCFKRSLLLESINSNAFGQPTDSTRK